MLMRLKELASWMQLDVPDQEPIEAGARARLLEQIGRFVVQQSQVRIDGATSRPLLDRVEFVRVSPQGIQSVGDSQRLTLPTALVGVILAYVTTGPPQEVTANWTYFNERITSIPATVIDPVSRLPYDVTRAEPTLRWTNLLDDYNYRVATIDAIAAQAGDWLEFSVPGVLLCPGGGVDSRIRQPPGTRRRPQSCCGRVAVRPGGWRLASRKGGGPAIHSTLPTNFPKSRRFRLSRGFCRTSIALSIFGLRTMCTTNWPLAFRET